MRNGRGPRRHVQYFHHRGVRRRGAGIAVAKHGNRSVTSRSGSADVLEALGMDLNADPSRVQRALDEAGITFMFAPRFHAAMKYAIGPRREIAIRTIFNILGPISNPAGVRRQVVGVFSEGSGDTYARVLAESGHLHAFVVHGTDGLDEVSLAAPTIVWEVREGKVKRFLFDPRPFGFEYVPLSALRGGMPPRTRRSSRGFSRAIQGPARQAVLVNAAFAAVAGGAAEDLREGVRAATRSIDSGAAMERLRAFLVILGKRKRADPPRSHPVGRPRGTFRTEGARSDRGSSSDRFDTRACKGSPPDDPGRSGHHRRDQSASPSRGWIRRDLDAVATAGAYLAGGRVGGLRADGGAVSGVAHGPYGRPCRVPGGDASAEGFRAGRIHAGGVPGARRRSRPAHGLRPRGEDGEMAALAFAHRLEPLVEARDAAEIAIAARSGARLIGINNRNLDTLTVDLSTGARLLPFFRPGCTRSWKADISTADQVRGLPRGRRPPLPDRGVPGREQRPRLTRSAGMWENERATNDRPMRKGADAMKVKFLLKDSEIPKTWYNIMADMPNRPAAVLHPGTGKPVSFRRSRPALPHAPDRAGSVVAAEIPIPEAVRDIYTLWRPTPMFRALRLGGGAGDEVEDLLQVRGRQPRGSHKPNTSIPQAYYNKMAGRKRIATETGAGQWGSAMALAGSFFGLEVRGVHGEGQATTRSRTAACSWKPGGEGRAVPSRDTNSGRAILAADPDTPDPSASRSARRSRTPRRARTPATPSGLSSTTSVSTRRSSASRRRSR